MRKFKIEPFLPQQNKNKKKQISKISERSMTEKRRVVVPHRLLADEETSEKIDQ